MVKIETRMDWRECCQACRTEPGLAREDLMAQKKTRIFSVHVKPIGSGCGTVFSFCREHVRDFIRGVNTAGIGAMGKANGQDKVLECQMAEKAAK